MSFENVSTLTDEQIVQLHQLYQNEWWSRGRSLDDVRKMLAFSDVVVGVCDSETNRLVAFARVLSDRVYKALVLDVIVASDYRSRGLGRSLMEQILEHPELADVRHVELYCLPEMAPFYRKWGFSADLGQLLFMRREGTAR